MIKELRNFIKENDLSVSAASISYFLFLSLIPMLIIICSLLPFTPLTAEGLLELLKEITPESMNSFLEDVVYEIYQSNIKIVSLALLVAFWSAGKGMMALIKAFNKIYKQKEERGYIRLRLVASGYTIITLFIILLSLCFGFLGDVFFYYYLTYKIGISLVVWKLTRRCIIIIVLFLFVLSIYSFIPVPKKKIRTQIPGAVIVTVIWGVFSVFFSVYSDNYSGFTAYGSIGIIILLLIWIYFISYILLIGTFFNKI